MRSFRCLSALLLACLSSSLAQAQEHVPTRALAGRFVVELRPGSGGPALRLPGEVDLEVSTHGRVRLLLDGRRARLVRLGDELVGRLAPEVGLAGALEGDPAPPLRVRLRVRGRDELAGTIGRPGASRELTLRRAGPDAARLALLARARAFVLAAAQTEEHEDRPLPPLDSGNDGLHAYLVEGQGAERLLALARAWFPHDLAVRAAARLDPAREVLLVVRTTDDEEVLHLAVLARDGEAPGRWVGDGINVVDLSYELDQAALDAIVPGLGPIDEVGLTDLLAACGWRAQGSSTWTALDLPGE
jgi:hypothetical protein